MNNGPLETPEETPEENQEPRREAQAQVMWLINANDSSEKRKKGRKKRRRGRRRENSEKVTFFPEPIMCVAHLQESELSCRAHVTFRDTISLFS